MAQALPQVYEELRRIACREFRRERPDHTLQATAIVHEAYLRLAEVRGLDWPSRNHFFAFAAHLMRRILVDHARHHNRAKRGGAAIHASLDEVAELALLQTPDLVALDDALLALERREPQLATLVELRFFAGLTLEETGEALGISAETVSRRWRLAKAWLHGQLGSEAAPR
jgi:RNA polymerase sigma factor (TIGR02999 family)